MRIAASILLCLMIASQNAWAGSRDNESLELRVSDPFSREVLLNLPLRPDETFAIRYIHSVDHTPIFEVFETDSEGRLAIQGTYFQMFGAGMGHWQGRGVIDFDGKWTWIRDIHETLDSFVLRIGAPSVAHTLMYRNRAINLSEKWPRRRVRFQVVETGTSGERSCEDARGGDDA